MAKASRLREVLRIDPGAKVRLSDFDPRETHGRTKEDAARSFQGNRDRLAALHDRFWADGRHRLLVILQGIDTSGKGGTVEHVMGAFDPAGVRVKGFGVPTPVELAHDYLWRVHEQVPGNGEVVIFDRSHYEDVLVVRVHELVPPEVWKQRYDQINAFERMLAQEGTTILKFFLHISPAEQKKRLLDRLKDETKQWKFNPGDLKERQLWKKYMQAYEDVLSRTSTEQAPWHIVPANKKWYRDWVVATALVETLEGLGMEYPKPDFDVEATLRDFESLAGENGE